MGDKGLSASPSFTQRALRRVFEKITGIKVLDPLPRGVDLCRDIAHSFPGMRISTVFDIGANIGQSADIYLHEYPDAHIFCFEPAASCFRVLSEKYADEGRVTICRAAAGSIAGAAAMYVSQYSDRNRLVTGDVCSAENIEQVDILTLDDYCEINNIHSINLLKIDTEGFDLDVLKGARRLLEKGSVGIIQVEAGMHAGNDLHVPFAALSSFLAEFRYELFAFYDQVEEWKLRTPVLRRTNPVFISPALVVRSKLG